MRLTAVSNAAIADLRQVPPKGDLCHDPAKPRNVSLLDAAAQMLAESTEPMNVKQMLDAVTAKDLWSSPKGKTPLATLAAAILREAQTKGVESRFRKVERGLFAAAAGR